MSKKILLADDSVTIQKVVSITLAHEDFELIIVDNGTEAISRAKEIRPDVILLDVVMPDKDGYEVCQEIKANGGLSKTPIILLTGTFEPFDEDRALEVGADDFIKKPFESHALINKIKEMVFKVGDHRPASVVDTEIEEIDGLDELEGIDDLSSFDDFETPTETRLSKPPKPAEPIIDKAVSSAPIDAAGSDLFEEEVDFPEVSLESSPLDLPEVSLDTPSDALPADAGNEDDIWSVDELDDTFGSEGSSGLEETDDLWGDEDLPTESEEAMPETAVIDEPMVEEYNSIELRDETEITDTSLDDDGFELGSDISIGDLETSADDSMFDDIPTGAKVSGDDLFPDEVHDESLDEVDFSATGGGEFNGDGFDMETSPLDMPEVGIELPGETPDGFDMDEFGADTSRQAPTPSGIELPGGGIGDLPPSESLREDSIELDWGDDSGGISETEEIFVSEDDFSDIGGDAGPAPEARKPRGFEPAPSENVMGETEWDMGEAESTPDTFGSFSDDADTIALDAGAESKPMNDMAGRSEEISRIVKETIVDGGILSEESMVGKSEKEVGVAVDKIAREIVQKVVWEVVPELAEELIKDEIRRLKGEKEG